jgi:hypothetical protein
LRCPTKRQKMKKNRKFSNSTLCTIVRKNSNPKLVPFFGCRLSRKFMLAIQTESSQIRIALVQHLFVCKRRGQMSASRFRINRNPEAVVNFETEFLSTGYTDIETFNVPILPNVHSYGRQVCGLGRLLEVF